MQLFKNVSCLVAGSQNHQLFKTGKQMNELIVFSNVSLLFDKEIQFIGSYSDALDYIKNNSIKIENEVNYSGKTIMPGLVDSHTHIVFAGDRSNEFGLRLRGATYKEIAESGGGIQSTVNATRNATIEELTQNGLNLLKSAIKHGTTTIEIKSGYSLNFEGEIKQLKAIKAIKEYLKNLGIEMNVVTTFMAAHDFPKELKSTSEARQQYIDEICNVMLPFVVENKLADYCDIFIDEGYFTNEDAAQIFKKSLELGLPIKAHCDELANVEAAGFSSDYGAVSVDHLLFISDESISKLNKNNTVANLLPGTAYFIRLPFAPARKLIDNDIIVSLASDCNPGSCYTENMQLIMNFAAINMKMTAEEVINASTINSAYSLRLSDKVGSLEVGKKADFIVLDTPNYFEMFYHFGLNHVKEVYISGKLIDTDVI